MVQAQSQQGFFDPWAPPPAFAPPPADTSLAERIKLLAKYAAQNGPTFIDTVAAKQAGNPEYAFLEPGGLGHEFYRWVLFCQLHGLPTDQPAPQLPVSSQAPIGPAPPASHAPGAQAAPAGSSDMQVDAASVQGGVPDAQAATAAPAAQTAEAAVAAVWEAHAREVAALPPEVFHGFTQVLNALTGSKESIKNSQAWFLACQVYAPGMARMMANHAMAMPAYERKLHVIYLANDILFKALAQRQQAAAQQAPHGTAAPVQSDPVARAFQPVLGAMLAAAMASADAPADARDGLAKVLSFWSDRGVFEASVVAGMQQAMDSKDPRAALAAAAAASAPGSAEGTAGAAAAAATAAQVPSSSAPSHAGAAATAAWPHAAAWPQAAAYPGHVMHPAYAVPQQAWPAAQPQAQQPATTAEQQDGSTAAPQQAAQGASGASLPQPPYPAAVPAPYAPVPAAGWYVDPLTGAAMPYVPAQPYPGAPMPVPGPVPGSYPSASAPGTAAQQPGADAQAQPGSHLWAQHQWAVQHAHHQQWAHFAQHQQQPQQQPLGQQQPDEQQQQQQQQQQDEEEQFMSSFNFPPGLIPQLVSDKARHSDAYSPLSVLDIEDAGLPPPPEKDAYLRARIERFHAEVRDWRPGTTRADFEERREREARLAGRELSDDDLPGGGSLARRRRKIDEGAAAVLAVDPETGMRADGSFAGPRTGGPSYAGLGSRPRPRSMSGGGVPSEGDMYSSYRTMRSGAYHDMILDSLAKGNAHSNLARGGR